MVALRAPFRRRGLAHVLALVVLALLPAFAFWPLLTPNAADRRSIVPGDFSEVHYPMHRFVVASWQQHRLPLWTPAVNAGQPAVADLQFDALYPPTALTGLLLGPAGRFSPDLLLRLEIGHLIFGELGMYLLLLRLLGRRRAAVLGDAPGGEYAPASANIPAAVAGAVIFGLSGYLTSYPIQDVDILQVSVWLPWAVLLLDLALVRRDTALALLAGLPVGLAVLAGHPQALLYLAYAHLLYTLVFAAARPRLGERLAALGRGLLALAAGLALGAAQLLPSLQLAPLTVRGNVGYDFLSGGFAPRELVGLVLRQGFGGASPAYLGPVALALAAIGLGRGVRGLRLYALLLGGLALLLSLGRNAPLYALAYLAAPGFNQIRDQERAIYLATFAVALLAAHGVQRLGREQGHRAACFALPGLALALAAVAVAGLLLAAPLRPGAADSAGQTVQASLDALAWALLLVTALIVLLGLRRQAPAAAPALGVALAGLCAVDLLAAHPGYGTQPGVAEPYPDWPIIATMQADGDRPFRVSSEGLLPADGNEGLIYGLEDVVGSTPLELSAFEAINAAERRHAISELQRFALLNVRYVVTKRTFPTGAPLQPLGRQGEARLYRLAPAFAFPRAWLVHRVSVAAGDDPWPALGRLDLRQEALLPAGSAIALAGGGGDHVEVAAFAADRLDLAVHAGSPGLLVISQLHYPGWEATLDGRPAALLLADGAIDGVAVPAGDHRLLLRFAPGRFRVGVGVAGATALALVGAAVALAARRPRLYTGPDVTQRGGGRWRWPRRPANGRA